jgi:hypothetical protein
MGERGGGGDIIAIDGKDICCVEEDTVFSVSWIEEKDSTFGSFSLCDVSLSDSLDRSNNSAIDR